MIFRYTRFFTDSHVPFQVVILTPSPPPVPLELATLPPPLDIGTRYPRSRNQKQVRGYDITQTNNKRERIRE